MNKKVVTVRTREKKLGPATRDAYGKALVELGSRYPNLVVLDGDLSKSTKTTFFAQKFPERFFNCGIQEANMIGMACGLASSGMIPFVSSFSCFATCKGYDQLRMGAAFPNANIKLITSHGGISVGEDGVSQQSIEDFALMTSLPNFKVIVPADSESTAALVKESTRVHGPIYMRCGRPKAPIVYKPGTSFSIGKGVMVKEGNDITLVACGLLVYEALVASDILGEKNISAAVIDMHTLKPIDKDLLVAAARQTGAMVTCEEHSVYGGLTSIVSRTVAASCAIPLESVAIQDTYAESGKPEELFEKYGLTANHIVQTAERVVRRK